MEITSIRLRQRMLFAAVAISGLVLGGCVSSPSDSTPGAESEDSAVEATEVPEITMVTPASTDEFYLTMYCGARAAAQEEEVDLTISGSTEIATDKVMEVLQTALATEPDGMLLTVWDTEAFNSTMKEYTDTGRPLVMPDSFISSGEYVQSIRTDSYQSSYDAAVQVVADYGLVEGKVLIVTDSPGNAIQSARAEGFLDGINTETGLEALEIQYIGNEAAKASNAVTSTSAANEDLALVFSTNIGAGTGAANGIASAGKDIVHAGYDTSSSQVAQLRNGDYDVLVAQSPYQMGFDALTLVAQILKGGVEMSGIEEQTVFSDSTLVTQDNVDDPEIARFLYKEDCS